MEKSLRNTSWLVIYVALRRRSSSGYPSVFAYGMWLG